MSFTEQVPLNALCECIFSVCVPWVCVYLRVSRGEVAACHTNRRAEVSGSVLLNKT